MPVLSFLASDLDDPLVELVSLLSPALPLLLHLQLVTCQLVSQILVFICQSFIFAL